VPHHNAFSMFWSNKNDEFCAPLMNRCLLLLPKNISVYHFKANCWPRISLGNHRSSDREQFKTQLQLAVGLFLDTISTIEDYQMVETLQTEHLHTFNSIQDTMSPRTRMIGVQNCHKTGGKGKSAHGIFVVWGFSDLFISHLRKKKLRNRVSKWRRPFWILRATMCIGYKNEVVTRTTVRGEQEVVGLSSAVLLISLKWTRDVADTMLHNSTYQKSMLLRSSGGGGKHLGPWTGSLIIGRSATNSTFFPLRATDKANWENSGKRSIHQRQGKLHSASCEAFVEHQISHKLFSLLLGSG
jgi:hypothetical protein